MSDRNEIQLDQMVRRFASSALPPNERTDKAKATPTRRGRRPARPVSIGTILINGTILLLTIGVVALLVVLKL